MTVIRTSAMLLHTGMLPGTIGNSPGTLVTGVAPLDGTADSAVDGWLEWGSEDAGTSFSVCPRSFLSSSSTVNIGNDSPLGRDVAADSELPCSNSCSISSKVFAPPWHMRRTVLI